MKNFNKTIYAAIAGYLFTSLLVTNLCQANEIVASFDRDLNHAAVTASASSLARENNLPEQKAVNRAVWTQEKGQVSESFKRDLNHQAVVSNKPGAGEAEPVAALVKKYLSIQRAKENSASISRK
jgi:hypothetical protein